jgi:hypothetical protein
MKVICTVKNLMNKKFQHFVESQLIEVRILKMQMIQFVSRLNLIQIKLMKVWKMKNMMNREFQHFMELQLIEVGKMKMQKIQITLLPIKDAKLSVRLCVHVSLPADLRARFTGQSAELAGLSGRLSCWIDPAITPANLADCKFVTASVTLNRFRFECRCVKREKSRLIEDFGWEFHSPASFRAARKLQRSGGEWLKQRMRREFT